MSNLNNKSLEELKSHLLNDQIDVILVKGPAGTGKTTLVKYLIEWLGEEEIGPYELMASTGRAAKILRNKTGYAAATIHGTIYGFKGLDGDDSALEYSDKGEMSDKESQLIFKLSSHDYLDNDCVFIVDEASMISDLNLGNISFAVFGSGRLLSDLFEFTGDNKVIFVGDEYQLPPVSDEVFSPALTADYIEETFNKKVAVINLTDIHRFNKEGFIYHISSYYRKKIDDVDYSGIIEPQSTEDISIHSNFNSFFNLYYELIKDRDYLKATYITPSNRTARDLNKIIREKLFPLKPYLRVGDLLLVAQNSHPYGLYNGDLIEVVDIANRVDSGVGLTFLQVKIRELINNEIKEILIIEDLLYQGQTNIDSKQHQKLLIEFTRRCKKAGIKPKSDEFYRAMQDDVYLNAVRAKFGYAITCHKSQGGEWEHVFVRTQNYIDTWTFPKPFQWKYTAVTRASKKLHIIRGSLNLKIKAPL